MQIHVYRDPPILRHPEFFDPVRAFQSHAEED